MMVSVIMPVYNAGSKLNRSILSVLNQTYQDFELIIVDDGSTDYSVDIIKQFRDYRICLIEQENEGASGARNTGIIASKGEYICFLDADDAYDSSYLELLLKHKSDLVICGIQYIYQDSLTTTQVEPFHFEKKEFSQNMEYILKAGVLNSPVNKLYKREIIERNHLLFRKDMKIGEDLNFNFRYLMHANHIEFFNSCLYQYYIENTGMHNSYVADIIEQRRINIDLIEDYFTEHLIQSNLIKQMKIKLIYIYLMQEMERETPIQYMRQAISVPYFKEVDSVQGLQYQILLTIYKMQQMWLMLLIAAQLKKLKGKLRGASL